VVDKINNSQTTTSRSSYSPKSSTGNEEQNETYMNSRDWLVHHGLSTKRLDFYDALSSVAFEHQEGLIDIKVAPSAADEWPCVADAVSSSN